MIHATHGGVRFAIATAVLAFVDVVIGLFALWKPVLPDWIITTLDSTVAGFYLGTGSVSTLV